MATAVEIFSVMNKRLGEIDKYLDKKIKKFSSGLGPFSKVDYKKQNPDDVFEEIDAIYFDELEKINKIEDELEEMKKKYSWHSEEYMNLVRGQNADSGLLEEVEEKLSSCFEKVDKMHLLLEKKYRFALAKIETM